MSNNIKTLQQQSDLLAAADTSSVELVSTALKRAAENTHLNAFVALDEGHALVQAELSDKRRKTGNPLSPIDGIPIAVKDNYLTKDYPTTACSNAKPLEPAGIDSTIVANLRQAGAVILGKTNMHEWAYGPTNANSNVGPTRNPHNPEHITAGSSGGSAAAVAAGIVSAALGSDTGGSIRMPASACGIYGFKPSYGRASRYGVLPLSWSLDAPGPMASSLDDVELLLPYFLGRDSLDISTVNSKAYAKSSAPESIKALYVTGDRLERSSEVDSIVSEAIHRSGAVVKDFELDNVKNYHASWEVILHSEASSYHQELLKQDPLGYSPVIRAQLEAGLRLSAIDLLQAQKLRAHLMHVLMVESGDWDVLVLPTLPVPAPKHGDDWQEFGGRKETTSDSMLWFCFLGNLTGFPCVTLPVGTSTSGLPIGMMLMGRPGQDEKLLAMAMELDRFIDYKD